MAATTSAISATMQANLLNMEMSACTSCCRIDTHSSLRLQYHVFFFANHESRIRRRTMGASVRHEAGDHCVITDCSYGGTNRHPERAQTFEPCRPSVTAYIIPIYLRAATLHMPPLRVSNAFSFPPHSQHEHLVNRKEAEPAKPCPPAKPNLPSHTLPFRSHRV